VDSLVDKKQKEKKKKRKNLCICQNSLCANATFKLCNAFTSDVLTIIVRRARSGQVCLERRGGKDTKNLQHARDLRPPSLRGTRGRTRIVVASRSCSPFSRVSQLVLEDPAPWRPCPYSQADTNFGSIRRYLIVLLLLP